jgi:hypothetical protein
VVLLNKLQEFKDSILEVLLIIKVCLTTVWFWIPPLVAVYIFFQLWLVFFVHPLTILILPVVFAVFAMVWEEKTAEARYGLDKVKLVDASDPLGTSPVWEKVTFDVEKAISEYNESLENAEGTKEEEKS